MGKVVEFTFEFDGPIPGKMIMADDGLPAPDPPPEPPNGNGDPTPDPPPTVEDDYHWFDTLEDISILTGDKKLNDKLVESQMVYRSGKFWGFIRLDPSSPDPGKPVMVYPRGGHIPFRFEGLANAGKTYGTGWYANKSGADAQPVQVRWLRVEPHGLGIEFAYFAPNHEAVFARVKRGAPTTWETYGLSLSWEIGVP